MVFRVPGRKINVRDLIDGFIRFLEKTKELGDLLSAANPIHASLPWAAVQSLLMVTTANVQLAGALYMGLEEVVRLLNRGSVYETHIAEAHRHRDADQLKDFEEAFVALYARIASFLASAHRLRKLNALRKAMHAVWRPEDIIEFRDDCDKLANQLSPKKRIFAMSTPPRTLYDRILEINSSTTDITRQLSKTNDDVKEILQRCNRQRRTEVLNWVSTIPVEDHHYLAKKDRIPKTGGWIMDTEQFKFWDEADEPLLLWLHGIRQFPHPSLAQGNGANLTLQSVLARRSLSLGSWTTSKLLSATWKLSRMQVPPSNKMAHDKNWSRLFLLFAIR